MSSDKENEEYYSLRQWADSLNERDKHNQMVIRQTEARLAVAHPTKGRFDPEVESRALERFKRIAAQIALEKKSFPVKRFKELAEKVNSIV